MRIGSEDLHTAADAAQINIKQTTQDASSGLYLERPGERRGYSVYVGPPNDGLTFRANNFGTFTTTMYLDRAGKVGIGTTSLSSSRLTVNGSAQISGALKIGGTASTNEISEYVEDFASISVRFTDDDSSLVNQGQQSAYAVKIGKFVSIHGALNFALLAGDDTTNNQNRAIYIRLPYPVTSASGQVNFKSCFGQLMTINNVSMYLRADRTSFRAKLFRSSDNTELNCADLGAINSVSKSLRFSMNYVTDA